MLRALSNHDIIHYFKKNLNFGGCISKDEMLRQEPLLRFNDRRFWVVNMENSNKGGGTHWILVSLLDPKHGIYFDSYATPPPRDILAFMKRYRSVNYMNEEQIQDIMSLSCGWYCLYIADQLTGGRKYLDILSDFTEDLKGYNESVLYEYFQNSKRLRP